MPLLPRPHGRHADSQEAREQRLAQAQQIPDRTDLGRGNFRQSNIDRASTYRRHLLQRHTGLDCVANRVQTFNHLSNWLRESFRDSAALISSLSVLACDRLRSPSACSSDRPRSNQRLESSQCIGNGVAFSPGKIVLLILCPDKQEQYQPRVWEMGVSNTIRAALATAASWGGKTDLAKSSGLPDHRMAIRAGLDRKLQRAKILVVKSQGFPPSLERLDQNESRSVMRHHHRVTPEPITDRNAV